MEEGYAWVVPALAAAGVAFLVIFIGRVVARTGKRPSAKPATGPAPKPKPKPEAPVAPPALPAARALWEEDDEDLTVVTLRLDQHKLAALGSQPTDSRDYLDLTIQEIDEDLEPKARTHRFVADQGAEADSPTMSTEAFLVYSARQTDRGKTRARNEDRYLLLHEESVFAVADGMGGYAGGDVAAELAVDSMARAFRSKTFDARVQADLPHRALELAQTIQMANLAIWEQSTDHEELRGMGTTLVAARFALRKGRLYVAHVGDSRCYRFRARELKQLTTDHTLEGLGMQAKNRRQAKQLVRALGIAPEVDIDLIIAEPRPGDIYLLCSDGLTKMVKDDRIKAVLEAIRSIKQLELDTVARALVDEANERGGRDNITVLLVAVYAPSSTYPPQRPR